MRTKIEATIPTMTYGNIRPTFELENDGDESLALEKLHDLWAKYGEKPLHLATGQIEANKGTFKKLTSFTGEEILWDEVNHVYTDMDCNVLLSGSKYADKHSPKFDLEMMLPKTANAWGVPEDDIRDIWKFTGDIANHWGSAVHMALDLFHKHNVVGDKIMAKKKLEQNYVLPKNSYLRKIVLEFIELAGTDALCEVLITDVANKMAGTVDRLVITSDMTCRIGDYKTNNEMDKKKLLKYQKQLSFYAHILTNKGWTIEGLDLYYLNADDGWSIETLEVLPLEG